MDMKKGPTTQKVKISCFPNKGMWGVYPEAMAWNVGDVHSDFNFGECMWRSGPQRANFIVHFEIGPLWATYPDTLTQIEMWVHIANIPGHCLWIDTPHAYVWAVWNFHFLICWPHFEVHFPISKNSFKPFFGLMGDSWRNGNTRHAGTLKIYNCHLY